MNNHSDSGRAVVNAPVEILEEHSLKPRPLRVICIGAGYSGLSIAYQYKYEWHMQDYVDLTIYEKNSKIGGTWLENRYPGVACDVPAHVYAFSFEPNPDWTQFYASGQEIWEYMDKTTKKYGLDEKIQFNSTIIETIWDESDAKWKVKIQKGEEVVRDSADVIINAKGFLNTWKWPDIKGIDDFEGRRLHSAQWDSTLDWAGKRVALIGNGSSAIQILPNLQKTAEHVTTFIRNPTWICPNFCSEFTKDGANFFYSEEQKETFRKDPKAFLKYRHDLEHSVNMMFHAMVKDSPIQAGFRDITEKMMRQRLSNNPELCDKLIPDFAVGCRRPTPGDGYLEALQAENVKVNFSGIDRFTATGILDADGKEEEFDIVICATGFDVSYMPPWKTVGRDGWDLRQNWQDHPEAYFGTCVPNLPNYFVMFGPNSPIANGSPNLAFGSSIDFMLRWIERIAKTHIRSICVSEQATRDFNDYAQEYLKRTVWSGGCASWYTNRRTDGRVTATYPGSCLHFREMLKSFRIEDFEVDYTKGNRFKFMGNGLTQTDLAMEDLAPHMH